MAERFTLVDEYIAAQPAAAQPALRRVRAAIREALPQAQETIAYNIPAYKLEGASVVQFAASKDHYALYLVDFADRGSLLGTNSATSRSERVRSAFHMEIRCRRA